MAARLPVRVTVTRNDGQSVERAFATVADITDNEFTVGTEWSFIDIAGHLGTFRVRNKVVTETDREILVEAVEIVEE